MLQRHILIFCIVSTRMFTVHLFFIDYLNISLKQNIIPVFQYVHWSWKSCFGSCKGILFISYFILWYCLVYVFKVSRKWALTIINSCQGMKFTFSNLFCLWRGSWPACISYHLTISFEIVSWRPQKLIPVPFILLWVFLFFTIRREIPSLYLRSPLK